MGKGGGGSSTTTVKQDQSPEDRQITQAAMNHYMPGGQFGEKPQFDPAKHSWMGENLTADFNSDHQAAFDATRATAFEHRPAMGAATQMAMAGAGPTGQEQALGTGWSTDANGRAKFADFNSGNIAQFMSPYKDNVVGTGLEEMQRTHDIQQLRVNDAARDAAAFGGSRHGIQAGSTTEGFARQARGFLADTLDRGYTQAVGQFNKERDEGQEALAWNKGVQDDNMKRLSDASGRVADLAKTNQDLNAKGVNALGAIGDMRQEREQQVLDTANQELKDKYLWQAQLGGMLKGFAPPPTTTQTQKTKSGGSIWGSIGSAALQAGMSALMMPSDEDAKENIKDADPEKSLAELRKLADRGLYTYEYNDDAKSLGAPEGQRTGFMAQDLEAATGEQSPDWKGGYKGVDVANMLGRLTHAVIALDKKVGEGAR